MALNAVAEAYLERAGESLAGAEVALAAGRVNNAANRAYFACFQAAVAALLANGSAARRPDSWGHDEVQAQFAGQLIRRLKRYPAEFARVLSELQTIRSIADYTEGGASIPQARGSVRRASRFVTEIERRERGRA